MTIRKTSINRIILINMAFIGAMSVFLLGILWVSSEWSRFENEEDMLHIAYIDDQKQLLKREVDRALNFVDYMQSQTEIRLRKSIKERVYEAYAIADNLYTKHKDTKNIDEIKQIIKEALRPIRFNNGRGYFFAFTLNGVETLFAAKPEMEGKNMMKVTGGAGELVVPEMIAIIKEKEEGFYTYTWSKPEQAGYFSKMAFVKLYKPIGWVIGTGEYVDDVEKDIQKECIKWISSIKFRNDGYLFAGQWDGVGLSGPATGKNMYDVEDKNGVKIVQELIAAAKEGGGYIQYVLPKFNDKKHAPKLSYSAGVPEWQWYIGSGVYLDEIERELALKHSQLEKRIRENIQNAFLIIVLILIIIGLVVKYLSQRIKSNMVLLKQFFSHAATDAIKIDRGLLNFSEFDQLAKSANQMVENQRKTEDSLRNSEKRLKVILSANPDPVVVYDAEGYLQYLNPAFTRVFGWSLDEVKGQRIPFVPDDQKEVTASKINEILKYGKTSKLTTKRLTKDGDVVDVIFSGAIIQEFEEKPKGLVVNLTDITNQKRLEARIHDAQRMDAIGTLAGGIAHDFNNMIGVITGNISHVLSQVNKDDVLYDVFSDIQEGAKQAQSLTHQLLTFAKGGEPIKKAANLNQLIKESAEFVSRGANSKCEFDLTKDLWAVEVDVGQFNQVISNMIINASQAMPNGGVIFIKTANMHSSDEKNFSLSAGRFVKIVIEDQGLGISEKHLSNIFEPYFSTKPKGSGLGLATSYSIIKRHGGQITVNSEIAKGTAFNIYLPASIKDVMDIETKEEVKFTGQGRILIMDDQESILKMVGRMLNNMGYETELAMDGSEAIEKYREAWQGQKPFDLVILDLTVPGGMGGAKTLPELLKINPGVKAVVSSGYSNDPIMANYEDYGFCGVVPKPYTKAQLAEALNKI